MTLEQIYARHMTYGFNEITGAVAEYAYGAWHIRVRGNCTSTAVLCLLLFDEHHIGESWSPLSAEEARRRIDADLRARELDMTIDGCSITSHH